MLKPNGLLEFDVRDTLDWDPVLDDRRIAVNADRGDVTLTGSVPSYRDKVRAVRDAWTVCGVRSVDSRLRVVPGTVLPDHEIAAACGRALLHDPLVPSDHVTASVSDNEVVLYGIVHRLFHREAAERAVGYVDGVVGIVNLIEVVPDPMPGDVADRVGRAFARSAVLDGARVGVTGEGHTIYLTGIVVSGAVMQEAVRIAALAPGADRIVNDLVVDDEDEPTRRWSTDLT